MKLQAPLILSLLSLLAPAANCQTADVNEITKLFSTEIPRSPLPRENGEFNLGNGVALTPDETAILATTQSGGIYKIGAFSGDIMANYTAPPYDNSIVSCNSKPVVADYENNQYIAYAVSDNRNSLQAMTRIVAVTLDLELKWISPPFAGNPTGSPFIGQDGKYIYITTNTNFTTLGNFAVIQDMGDSAEIVLEQADTLGPFAPLGGFAGPAAGNYRGGLADGPLEANTNDMILFTHTFLDDDAEVNPARDVLYGFQFPRGYTGVSSGADPGAYFELRGRPEELFVSIAPPMMFNDGFSAYIPAAKSTLSGLHPFEDEGLNRGSFNDRHFTANFERLNERGNAKPWAAMWTTPVKSSDPVEPIIFGSSASYEVYRIPADFRNNPDNLKTVVTTNTLVKIDVQVAFDTYVYYIEQDDGLVHQANFNNLSDKKTYTNIVDGDVIEFTGQSALRSDGSVLYVPDGTGSIVALQVAELVETASPTMMPSASPTTSPAPTTPFPSSSPSASPTSAPTTSPTMMPTESPTNSPTSMPTTSPTSMPTSSPTMMPTSMPTKMPTSSPTKAPTTDAPTKAPTTDAPTTAPTSGSATVFSGAIVAVMCIVAAMF